MIDHSPTTRKRHCLQSFFLSFFYQQLTLVRTHIHLKGCTLVLANQKKDIHLESAKCTCSCCWSAIRPTFWCVYSDAIWLHFFSSSHFTSSFSLFVYEFEALQCTKNQQQRICALIKGNFLICKICKKTQLWVLWMSRKKTISQQRQMV